MNIFTAMTSAAKLEEAFKAKDCTSLLMKDAIEAWFALYYDRPATTDSDPCQRIAYTVVNKLCKTCFGEYQATSKDEYAQSVLNALGENKREAMQMLLAGGEAFIKPVPMGDRWLFNIIRRNNVLVFGRNANGDPCDIGTIERTTRGSKFYTLLERRTVDAYGRLTIRNMLYSSDFLNDIGRPVPLSTLPQYEQLAEEYTYTDPLGGLGLVYLRMPIENVVDGSPDGVSVYAAAVGLIHNIDRNEALINGEFERGQSRIIASSDLMVMGKDGKRRFEDNIFVGLDDDPKEVGVTIFSPDLRVAAFHDRKREYLRNVETVIGIKRGLLSEVEAVERTAKEVTSSEGDYNLTIIDLQEVWTQAVHDTVKLCGVLGKLYSVKGAHDVGEDAVTIEWGNGVLYDQEKAKAETLDLVARGLLKPEIGLGKVLGMPTETEADLNKVRKLMPTVEDMAGDGGDED